MRNGEADGERDRDGGKKEEERERERDGRERIKRTCRGRLADRNEQQALLNKKFVLCRKQRGIR